MRLFCNSGTKLPLVFVLSIFVLFACTKDNRHPVPNIPVDFVIYTGSTQHIELNSPGGWAYFTGGFRGIIIYRLSVDEFKAFDRACPVHPFDERAIVKVTDPPIATCDSCKSSFSIIDGSRIPGGAGYPLKEYRTFFDYPWLRVSN